MTTTRNGGGHAGLPRLHQGDPAGGLGRDHSARVDASVTATGARAEYELRPGGAYRVPLDASRCGEMGASEVLIDGEVLEADPPRRLVQTWRALWSPELAAEGPTRLTWEIDEDNGGVTTPDRDPRARRRAGHSRERSSATRRVREGGGGWSWILSDLKSLLETGESIA